MKITALEEYGLRCMLQLAKAGDGAIVTAGQIAESEGLSTAYAEKLLRLLSRAGLAKSVRGVNGGYRLGHPVAEITLGDVFRALGEMPRSDKICSQYTGQHAACVRHGDCGVRPIWAHIVRYLSLVLDSITLTHLLESERYVEHWVPSVTDRAISSSGLKPLPMIEDSKKAV
ncbi:MAG: Rrf2 family transcriptional regulator [Armatimonadetes bacterium]|nr:Rrf2 family transcriptional regulator [Armatimonadota bacterium]